MLDLSISLDDKYKRERGPVYLNGTQALVRMAMLQAQRDRAAGLNTAGFVSGYRGSPLAALDFEFWRARKFLEPLAIRFQPGLNEDLAATAVWGTQQLGFFPKPKHDGVFALWYGKSPGVDRCGDVFKHANHAGTTRHGGVLALIGDDHAQKSTSTTSQSEYAMMDAMIPVVAPADLQEFIDLGLFGIALSRYAGLWVALKLVDSNIGASGTVTIDPDRLPFALPNDVALPPDGVHARWPDDRIPQEYRLKHVKLPATLGFARANRIDRLVHDSAKARLGIAASGKAWLDLAQALDALGLDAAACSALGLRVLKIGMIWPLEPETIVRFADGLEEILVVEEKRGFIEDQIKTILYDRAPAARPRVIGKRDEVGADLIPDCLELEPNQVAIAVADRVLRFAKHADLRARRDAIKAKRPPGPIAPVHVRMPFFCSGCPHNTSTVVPEGSIATAGIGCHSMAIWTGRALAFTHMGGEGAQWIGIAPYTETPHLFQNVGDGTYYHSASLAIRAAVAAKVSITFKLLFNDAVAMTGGQPVDGPLTVPQITRQLADEGVSRVVVVADDLGKYPLGVQWAHGVTFRHRDELDAVQRELRETEGVTALVYDQTCAAEKRRRRKRGTYPDPAERIFINELVCEGCGDCGRVSNCISVQPVETEFGTKRRIDQSNCNKDFSCIKGFCPSFVTVEGGRVRKRKGMGDAAGLPALPEPAPAKLDAPWPILVTGVGGTGVVTIGAIFGMAAHLEGRACSVSDVVGLSQKNGPVLSQIVFAPDRASLHSPQIASSGAKALIATDLVTSTMPEALGKLGMARAVVNLEETRTGEFVQNFDKRYEGAEMRRRLEARLDATHSDFIPATKLALALVGDSIATNMFMAGFAWQKGLVPLSRDAIEHAIKLNGAAVDANLGAFAWGRRAAHDLAAVERAAKLMPAAGPETLDQLIARRAEFLTGYQNAAYAARYRAVVERLRKAEAERAPGARGLADAVARNFFKLMAYKDEYEVARLYTDGTFLRRLNEQFEGGYKLRFHLAPPLLAPRDPATGRLQKRRYGPWVFSAFKLLARLRFLRGSVFDVFGKTAERRGERRLIAEYETLMDEIARTLSPANHATAVELARIPKQIRGYGHVKEANLAAAKRNEAQLCAAFRNLQPARVAAE
jgi:indolepyruvate ferredoxin oxidoreductase